MAEKTKFISTRRAFVIRPDTAVMNADGEVVKRPAIVQEFHMSSTGAYVLETSDPTIIDKLRKSKLYGTKDLHEFTPEEKEYIQIKEKKMAEAQAEIDRLKKERFDKKEDEPEPEPPQEEESLIVSKKRGRKKKEDTAE